MHRKRLQHIRRSLIRWFARAQRDLPWRKTRSLYRILVSEMMLQQTQVDRVIPKYRAFLKRWPTVKHLARAQRRSVIKAWSGLGYNRRAVHLHAAAKEVMNRFGGNIPSDVQSLESLPGIGPYTARAVVTFAEKRDETFIDTNVRRVLGRALLGKHFPTLTDDVNILQALRESDPTTQPPKLSTHRSQIAIRRSRIFHSALMDLGATICKPKPQCGVCPLQQHCASYPSILQNPQQRPSAKQKPFHNSDRYWRGQILQCLRHAPASGVTLSTLRKQLPKRTSARRLNKLLKDLNNEGLVASSSDARSVLIKLA